jgi:hypothetical protein
MRWWLPPMALAVWLTSHPATATSTDQFLVRRTQDLIVLCTTPETDPLHTAAMNFCHGYLLGAFHYHQELNVKAKHKNVCLPDPPPTRTQGVQEFIKWTNANPQYMNECAVETLAKFLVEKWPCPK